MGGPEGCAPVLAYRVHGLLYCCSTSRRRIEGARAMNLAEYTSYVALGLAEWVARKEVSPKELALSAVAAKEKVDGPVNAVVELYADRIEGLDEARLGHGPFRGVPFLIKDVFGHEKG